jgi:NAD(P)-dependent dehydrogenase (short-subunit alcohol dehydrogenase family)
MSAAIDFNGRVALVTGGARGIGYAISQELLRLGASLVMADNGAAIDGNSPDVTVATQAAAALGPRCAVFTDDISEPGAAEATVRLAQEKFGALDFVVNNAAILRDGFVFKLAPADWEAVLRVNLTGAFRVLAAATPVLREAVKQGRAPGRIVNIVSSAGLYGNAGTAPYAASKGGLLALTRVTAQEMARSAVTCNAVAPFAATRVTHSLPPALQAYKDRALRVPAVPVARLVAFLCSSGAQHISGQLFGVRGREIMLFSQPRPLQRAVVGEGDYADLEQIVGKQMVPAFTDLSTDLDAFNTDPVI